MAKHVLHINEDIKCKQCGKGGACKAGDSGEFSLCLECVNKKMEGMKMKIGPRTRGKAVELISRHFEMYQDKIEEVYCRDDGSLAITIKVIFESAVKHGVNVITKIGFVESKVSGESSEVVDEEQLPIF